jgi:hypothetical protein
VSPGHADSCPVNCIHRVKRDDLPVLEHVMKCMTRVSVGTMNSYHHTQPNVFTAADTFRAKKREGQVARRSWTEVRSLYILLAQTLARPTVVIASCPRRSSCTQIVPSSQADTFYKA